MVERTQSILAADQLGRLIEALVHRGYQVLGPTVRDGAIVCGPIASAEDLPAGRSDEQAPGHYRLTRREDQAFFCYGPGPDGWKAQLHPSEVRLLHADRAGTGFVLRGDREPSGPPVALLGVRPCDLAAIAALDRVLLDDRYPDPVYRSRRRAAFIAAIQCTESAATCFCASLGTAPPARGGFDLALTELLEHGRHRFLVEVGTERGEELLAELETAPAAPEDLAQAAEAVAAAARRQVRRIDPKGLPEILRDRIDDRHWDEVAARCLCCGSCTTVCPTCFCTTVDDWTDVTGQRSERWRRWDSCFTLSFSYIHGGSVRASSKARYRQWLTHKLSTWQAQFGTLGCVGCGRCITWCPVGIDITEEVRALRGGDRRGAA